jgi:hypothetical protein
VFPWTLWLFDGIKIEHQTVVTYMFNITLWGAWAGRNRYSLLRGGGGDVCCAENPVLIAEDFLSLSLTEHTHTYGLLALTEEKIRFGACLESCSATETFST